MLSAVVLITGSSSFAKVGSYPKLDETLANHSIQTFPVVASSEIAIVPGLSSTINPASSHANTSSGYILLDESVDVSYEHELIYYENDETHVGVNLTMYLRADGNELVLKANDDVDRMVLDSSTTMIKGPLFGEFTWNDIDYDFSVGFTKLEESSNLSLGLTITSLDEKYQVCYRLGTPVMTQDLYAALGEYGDAQRAAIAAATTTLANESSEATVMANPNYMFCASASGMFIDDDLGSPSGQGAYIKVFKDNFNKRFMVTLESNLGNLTIEDFPNEEYIESYIHAFQVGLQRTSTEGYIAGMEEMAMDLVAPRANLSEIFNKAGPLLSFLPYPYNLGAAIIGTVLDCIASSTTVQSGSSTDSNYVHCTMGGAERLNLDEAPLPVVFQLANSASVPVTFIGNAFVDLTYTVELRYSTFYVRTTRAQVNVSMAGVN